MATSPESSPENGGSNTKNGETERLRINRAFQLSIIGLMIAAAVVLILALVGKMQASEITSIAGLFTSVVGTLVGAFFGLQIGSAGKEKAETRADETQKRLDQAQKGIAVTLRHVPEDKINAVREQAPYLFS